MEVIKEKRKKYTKRILYSKNVHNFKINMPFGNEEMY
jgi:hypothetical protein